MSNPVLATIVAVPLLVVGLAVAYQVGDYLDPERTQQATIYRGHEYGERPRSETPRQPSIEKKIGRGIKQGVAVVVGVPIAVVVGLGLLVYAMAQGKGAGGGSGYDDGG